ncbi:MAG: glutaminase A [Acidimicrobiia bacterium]
MQRSPVLEHLRLLLEEYRSLDEGEVATYIPELGSADPASFGIAVVTTDGHVYEVGDTDLDFTIQSISKPFVFGMALEDCGRDAVLERVGVEPSGNPFNAIVVDDRNRPFNPMVNAGAIVATGLIDPGFAKTRMHRIMSTFGKYAGRDLSLDEKVYRSESATGDRNRSIAWLMRSFGTIDGDVDSIVDDYFRQCSVLVNCRDLAAMAATLANKGVNPVTGEHALDARYVENVLSVMSTCGMYDYAGEWVYTVGLPAKSGVAGGVIAVLPGQLGIGVFSPRLDERGNSARGIRVCQRLAHDFDLHPLRFQPEVRAVVRRSYHAGETRSNRVRTPTQYDFLALRCQSVVVFELQGDLFFSSAERLYRTVTEELADATHVIFDCRRVGGVDDAAVSVLHALREELDERDIPLLATDLGADHKLAPIAGEVFADTDAALEWCEEALLAQAGLDDGDAGILLPLAEQELLAGMSHAELAAIEALAECQKFEAGEVVVAEGDESDAVYFLRAGRVRVRLQMARGRERRLATLGAGVAFGEMAFLDELRRSADIVAETDTVVDRLPIAEFRRLAAEHPGITERFAVNMVRNLGARLRRANDQVRRLAE